MTLSRVVEDARLRKPRNQPTKPNVASDFNRTPPHTSIHSPNISHLPPSRLSRSNSSGELRESVICGKPKKMFFLGLGCKGASMAAAAAAPRIIRSGADWETENERRRKRRGSKVQNRTRNAANVDICCAPPGISFSCDVLPSTSPRHVHVQHSRVARRDRNINYFSGSSPERLPNSLFSRAHYSSNAREFPHHHHSGRGISEANAIFGRSDEGWRHNVDSMLYEELLLLSEKIGYEGRGLSEDAILGCLSIFKPADFESRPLLISIDKEWKCSICQEGCRATDSIGRLGCGHCHHIDCIKQWLRLKNECPVCKTAPIADK